MKYYLSCILVFCSCSLSAQNLVPNYSFEDVQSCNPPTGGFYQNCLPWFSLSATPDYFNECAYPWSTVSVPSNYTGYQYARTGGGYAGLGCFGGDRYVDGREYLCVPLNETLKLGMKYSVSFYASLAENINFSSNCLGLAITDSIPRSVSPDTWLINLTPQIDYVSSFTLSDSINWTEISGTYIAKGGEKYITIGCFRPDSQILIDTLPNYTTYGPYRSVAYYYIDDVFVLPCPDSTSGIGEEHKNDNILGNNIPNPFSTSTTITYRLHTSASGVLIVSDVLGREILRHELSSLNSEIEIDMKSATNGIYFYKMIADGKLLGIKRMMVVR